MGKWAMTLGAWVAASFWLPATPRSPFVPSGWW